MVDAKSYEEQLRALQEARMGAARPLAERASAVARARAALDEEEARYARAWAAAIAAGWTDAELRKVFKDAPAAPARPRSRARGARPSAPTGVDAAGGEA
ncbi:MAG: hypothetical protein BGO26_00285 [Actinobacteria bacterium 69-20]|jgi:hypothetical protein|nr:MAG: hypothetical protein BGO26_00285 [Actinobacteria bacterium 69-20]